MRGLWRTGFWVACVGALSLGLIRLWYAQPQTFPALLRSLGQGLVARLSPASPESAADFEFVFVAIIAVAAALAITLLLRAVWRAVSPRP